MALTAIISGQAANDADASELRCGADRRQMSWRTVVHGFLRSRRRRQRRADEAGAVHLDWQHPWLFLLAVGVMLMSVTDAFLTLQLLSRGAVELNPVMRGLIDWNTAAFVSAKLLLTGLGLMTLVFANQHRLFGKFRVGLVITAFFCGYAILIFHELMGLMALTDTF